MIDVAKHYANFPSELVEQKKLWIHIAKTMFVSGTLTAEVVELTKETNAITIEVQFFLFIKSLMYYNL